MTAGGGMPLTLAKQLNAPIRHMMLLGRGVLLFAVRCFFRFACQFVRVKLSTAACSPNGVSKGSHTGPVPPAPFGRLKAILLLGNFKIARLYRKPS